LLVADRQRELQCIMASVVRPLTSQPVPIPRTPLVGRDREMAAIVDLLLRPSVPLVTLTGPAGIGKTRLALQVAADLHPRFALGVRVVPLAPLGDPALVAATIAEAFGIVDGDASSLAQRLQALLQVREQDVLLLLDNCEHVVAAAPFIAELLLACPSLKALATSRTSLRISGEHDFPVPPLALPDSLASSSRTELVEAASVALFVQRATEIDPSFRVNDANAVDIAEICIGLDGLPLAIELAAARTRLLTPIAIRARLTNRLALLTDGPRDQPPRLRSMREAIAWSYDLLPPEEQKLFRRLSVFVGSISLEVVDRLAPESGGSDNDVSDETGERAEHKPPNPVAMHLLSQLVEKSLVQAENRHGDEIRFRLLETIREYGLDRLSAAGEALAARDLHAETYLTLAESAEPHQRGPHQSLWFDRMDDDYANVRAALAWFRERGRRAEALRLAGAIGRFWEARGHLGEGRGWLESLLAGAVHEESPVPAAVLAKAESWAGTLTYWQGDFAQSDALHARAIRHFEAAGDDWGAAHSLLNQGQSTSFQGDLERAISLITASLERFQALGDAWGIAAAMSGLVNPYLESGDLDRVAELLSAALPLVRGVDDPDMLAMTLLNVGWLAIYRADHERAEQALTESLALFRGIGERRTMPYSLNLLGMLAWHRQDQARASSLWMEGLALSRDLGNQLGVVNSLEMLAFPAIAVGLPNRAACLLGSAESVREAIGAPHPPIERRRLAEVMAAGRAALGADEFAAAYATGRALSLHEAIVEGRDFAASLADTACQEAATIPSALLALTRRERDIMRLLVEGLSNPEIAAALFISPKTVRNHVTNIFTKLGVESRTAAATYALRNGLIQVDGQSFLEPADGGRW
jgi:non-specific serine/threonine protein kinase